MGDKIKCGNSPWEKRDVEENFKGWWLFPVPLGCRGYPVSRVEKPKRRPTFPESHASPAGGPQVALARRAAAAGSRGGKIPASGGGGGTSRFSPLACPPPSGVEL